MELISREEVERLLIKWFAQEEFFDLKKAVDELPTIESRPKGKWKIDIGCGECSNCGWIITAGEEEIDNYCPHCGADMREGE